MAQTTQATEYPKLDTVSGREPRRWDPSSWGEEKLYAAIELSKSTWRFRCSAGGTKTYSGATKPGDARGAKGIFDRAKRKLGLPEDAQVVCCIEAGRDGFWPHRFLVEFLGVENVVIDAASMKVSRHRRRAKTDSLDLDQLLADRVRYDRGDENVWRVARVPSRQDEADRYFHRELEQLRGERTRLRNQVRSLLATEGLVVTVSLMRFLAVVDKARNWEGAPLTREMVWRLGLKRERLELVERQIKEIEKHQQQCAKKPETKKHEMVAELARVRGIGVKSAWLVVMEMLGWKEFANRKQVGGSVGLGGTPYNTGESVREQGITKNGNARVRDALVELSWLWIRYQPNSSITKWFQKRYGGQGKRMRRIGIVGVARRLLIQLWHLVEHGVDPPGAIIAKPATKS